MSINLPRGWALAKIPDLVGPHGVFSDGDWVESEDQDPNGDVRLIQLADVGDGAYINKSNRFLTKSKARDLNCTFLKLGDVLVARMPDPLGRACIFPGDQRDSVTVVDVCVIRVEQEHIDNRWLMHVINSPAIRAEIHALQSGSTRKRISRGNLSTISLPLAPRAEQTRIVEKLEELLSNLGAGVAELKAAQRKLTQYRKSLLKAAVEGTLTADWRAANGPPQEAGAELLQRILDERRARWEQQQLVKFAAQGKTAAKGWQAKYPEPLAPSLAGLPSIPKGWAWASLDQLVAESSYGTSVKCGYGSNGDPVFRIPNVRGGKLDLQDMKFATEDLDLMDDDYLAVGDVLVIRTNGSIGLVGRAAVVPTVLPAPHYFASYLLRLRCVEKSCTHQWVSAVLASSFGRRWIEARAASSAGQHNISLSTLLTMPVPLPPLAEQARAITAIEQASESVDQHENEFDKSLKQAVAQRKNLLKAAFAGQLVPQDPNDEPASDLLARIRADRASNDGKAPRRRRKTA